MKISIVVLTFSRKQILATLLVQLNRLISKTLEVIVVDNGSTDGTMEMVTRCFRDVIYIRMPENIGVGARNAGFSRAGGDLVISLDDDILGLTAGDIDALKKVFAEDRRLGALNFRVIDDVTGQLCNWVHHREEAGHHHLTFSTYEITEGAVAFCRHALVEAGYYPEAFFLSHEGPDLALRLLDKGYDVRYAPLVTVTHSHSDQGRKPWYRYYYDTRNQFLLAIRHFPVMYIFKYLTLGVISTCFYALRDGFFRYWWRGLKDGIVMSKQWASQQRRVLNRSTMDQIKQMDHHRPSLAYMIRKRVFGKGMRL